MTIDAVHPDLCPGIMCDNRSGMYAAVQHLIAHGHRRIAFVNFSAHPPMQACCDGYQDALAEAGIPFDPALVHDVTSWTDDLGPAVQRWLALGSPCTAIATGVDSYALSAIEALQQAGYCVPDDIAVTGFDDYEFAQHTTPALTSVRKPFTEIGRRAAQLVLAQIAGQSVAPGAVLLPGILVTRRSCGCGLTSLLPSPGADDMDLFLEETDLLPLLRGVMATAIGLTKDKGIELTLDVPETLPPVMIDRTRIRQVLLNLLSNAAKFTDQGGITLRVSSELPSSNAETQNSELKTQNWLVIEVQDSGIGITPESQALVFEEFRQVQDDLTRQYQGTGLGLPISKRLVEMHGGTMWLESTPAVGSTFRFSLPTNNS